MEKFSINPCSFIILPITLQARLDGFWAFLQGLSGSRLRADLLGLPSGVSFTFSFLRMMFGGLCAGDSRTKKTRRFNGAFF